MVDLPHIHSSHWRYHHHSGVLLQRNGLTNTSLWWSSPPQSRYHELAMIVTITSPQFQEEINLSFNRETLFRINNCCWTLQISITSCQFHIRWDLSITEWSAQRHNHSSNMNRYLNNLLHKLSILQNAFAHQCSWALHSRSSQTVYVLYVLRNTTSVLLGNATEVVTLSHIATMFSQNGFINHFQWSYDFIEAKGLACPPSASQRDHALLVATHHSLQRIDIIPYESLTLFSRITLTK